MLRRLFRHYRSDRRRVFLLVAFGLATAAAEAGALIAVAPMLQAAAEGTDDYTGDLWFFEVDFSLVTLAWIAAGLVLWSFVLTIVSVAASSRAVSEHQRRRRVEVVADFLDADWETQSQTQNGRLVAFAQDFVNQSAAGLRDVATLVRSSTGLLVFLGGAMAVSWLATLAIAVTTSLVWLAQRPVRRRAASLTHRYGELNVEMSEEISDLESAARELRVAGVGVESAKRLRQVADEQRRVRVRADVASAVSAPMLRAVGTLVIVGLIGYASSTRSMEVAALGVVVVLLYRSLGYGQTAASAHSKLNVLLPLLEQLESERQRHAERRVQPSGATLDSGEELRADDVAYRYPGAASPAVRDVSFAARRGETIGIVGPSGAGKSTLADLLVGLREPTSGSMRLDGVELRELSVESRARRVTLLPQHVAVLAASIADNVDFHRGVGIDRIGAALAAVGLSDTVNAMPLGSDTVIGSGARALSGGQAQRVGIARALVADTDFVVLDEPTSALDANSENLIVEVIERLREHAGVIVIAHRLSTLRHCGRVIVVEDGRVTGDGSLAELRTTNAFVRDALHHGSLDWTHDVDEFGAV